MDDLILFKANTAVKSGGCMSYRSSTIELEDSSTSIFESNTAYQGGAIYGADGSLILAGYQTYFNNSAQEGGAMALFRNLKLVLNSPLQINFTENQAHDSGGALYVQNKCI